LNSTSACVCQLELPDDDSFRRWAELALQDHLDVTIRVVDEEESQSLNRDYRHRLSYQCTFVSG
jgi:probable rRNA maturation factor